jgi:hypothetical protein
LHHRLRQIASEKEKKKVSDTNACSCNALLPVPPSSTIPHHDNSLFNSCRSGAEACMDWCNCQCNNFSRCKGCRASTCAGWPLSCASVALRGRGWHPGRHWGELLWFLSTDCLLGIHAYSRHLTMCEALSTCCNGCFLVSYGDTAGLCDTVTLRWHGEQAVGAGSEDHAEHESLTELARGPSFQSFVLSSSLSYLRLCRAKFPLHSIITGESVLPISWPVS